MNLHHPYEGDIFEKQKSQALGFGRFLQKLNIIRDFHEDRQRVQGNFWPQELLDSYSSKKDCLNFLCKDTLLYDAELAINFYEELPDFNESFALFIKFILFSGLEYIKILKNNNHVFSQNKVKLPKIIITSLYKKISTVSKDKFIRNCYDIHTQELESYKELLSI